MAQQKIDSKIGDVTLGNDEAVSCAPDKQFPMAVKKTPLRDLRSENNIIPLKSLSNPLALKEALTTDAAKVTGTKRSSPDTHMNPHQQSPNSTAANGRLVYVRRRSDGETGKSGNSEVIPDHAQSPSKSEPGDREDGVPTKTLDKELPTQCLSVNAPIPTSPTMCIPSAKPSIPSEFRSLDSKLVSEEHQSKMVTSPVGLPAEDRVNKQNWEERYIQLQMYLKKIDQSSLEDHLQMLRSLSAVELSRHAIELEKRAIQLSLEQGKELQRVKALNVLAKSLKTTNGPAAQQKTPQN
ncbi:hypothetical protein RND81_09G140800 [Saponaria officinalis]|uniref:Uncharacterized protein n=1 Tax=Saponaria officinalis TaxID=3572 RepID=A0AAW1ILE3_SAPOF